MNYNMKHIIGIIASLFILSSCSSKVSKTLKQYKFVQIYTFPSTNEYDSIYQHKDSATIFFLGNTRILKIAYGESLVEFDVLKYDTTKWYYFGIRENEKEAVLLKNLEDPTFRFANIDSFYTTRPNTGFLDSVVREDVKKNRNNQLLSKKQQLYTFELKGFETVTLSFDKTMKNIPYSLSPAIDSMFKSKLTGIKLVMFKKDLPPNTDEKFRIIEIKLQQLAFSTVDSTAFYFKNRVDSLFSKK